MQDGARRDDRLIHVGARYLLKGTTGMAIVKTTGIYRDATGHALYLVEGENIADDIAARYTLDGGKPASDAKFGAPENRADAVPQVRSRKVQDNG